MKIENVFIQATDGMPDDEAFFKAWHGFAKRRVPCELVSATELESGSLPLRRSTLVAGGIRTVEAAIKQIGMRTPVANNLPDELSPWFGRNIRKTTLGELRNQWNLKTPESCFIKPLDKNKLFPAIAMFDQDDLATLDALDDGTRVLVSEYVLFESEWRYLSFRKKSLGCRTIRETVSVTRMPTKSEPQLMRSNQLRQPTELTSACSQTATRFWLKPTMGIRLAPTASILLTTADCWKPAGRNLRHKPNSNGRLEIGCLVRGCRIFDLMHT